MEKETMKILICDDSSLARKHLKNYLTSIGCINIAEAENGMSAIETYKTQKPDLVFLDIVMPVKNGIETAEEILEYDKQAYIVMASSVGTRTNLQKALELGVKDFIQKPTDPQQVLRAVNKVIKGGL